MTTTTPEDAESKRQSSLASYDILDSEAERSFDELAKLAATVCRTPMAIISFIAADRQWFKATVGLALSETPRNIAFCDHTIARGRTLVVPDATLDPSFSTNPLVVDSPGIRFYAGSPLQAADGSFIGTVAVLDVQPGTLSAAQRSSLELIARLAMDQVEKRARTRTLEANLATESKLRASQQRFRKLLDSIPAIVVVYGPDLRIRYINSATTALTGMAPEAFLGKRDADLFEPKAHRPVLDLLDKTLQTCQRQEMEFELERPDGTRHLHISCVPLVDDKGKIQELIGITHDLTESIGQQERARLALAASEERFRKVAQVTSDVIWDLDLAARTVWWSEGLETTFGIPASEVSDDLDWWAERVHPDDRDAVVASLDATIASGQTSWTVEYRFRKQDGNYAEVRDTGLIIRDEANRATRMVGGLRDLTQEHALKEQVARSQRLESIGQLTGGIAHDFNNLLTVILGNSELLGEFLEGDDKTIHLARMIQSAAQRGAELTSRLLAFARRQDLDPEPTDLKKLVNDMRPLLRRSVPANVTVR
ncbi:MAG: PAS domain-containing protein, partial [Wenzhouxiangella sp.]